MNKLYIKLMTTNIKNGKKFYLPYILSGILIVTLFYNILAIYYNEGWRGCKDDYVFWLKGYRNI